MRVDEYRDLVEMVYEANWARKERGIKKATEYGSTLLNRLGGVLPTEERQKYIEGRALAAGGD